MSFPQRGTIPGTHLPDMANCGMKSSRKWIRWQQFVSIVGRQGPQWTVCQPHAIMWTDFNSHPTYRTAFRSQRVVQHRLSSADCVSDNMPATLRLPLDTLGGHTCHASPTHWNLVVTESPKAINAAVTKAKSAVEFKHRSTAASEKRQRMGLKELRLKQDVVTRQNSHAGEICGEGRCHNHHYSPCQCQPPTLNTYFAEEW